jgi:hypothetical protein
VVPVNILLGDADFLDVAATIEPNVYWRAGHDNLKVAARWFDPGFASGLIGAKEGQLGSCSRESKSAVALAMPGNRIRAIAQSEGFRRSEQLAERCRVLAHGSCLVALA